VFEPTRVVAAKELVERAQEAMKRIRATEQRRAFKFTLLERLDRLLLTLLADAKLLEAGLSREDAARLELLRKQRDVEVLRDTTAQFTDAAGRLNDAVTELKNAAKEAERLDSQRAEMLRKLKKFDDAAKEFKTHVDEAQKALQASQQLVVTNEQLQNFEQQAKSELKRLKVQQDTLTALLTPVEDIFKKSEKQYARAVEVRELVAKRKAEVTAIDVELARTVVQGADKRGVAFEKLAEDVTYLRNLVRNLLTQYHEDPRDNKDVLVSAIESVAERTASNTVESTLPGLLENAVPDYVDDQLTSDGSETRATLVQQILDELRPQIVAYINRQLLVTVPVPNEKPSQNATTTTTTPRQTSLSGTGQAGDITSTPKRTSTTAAGRGTNAKRNRTEEPAQTTTTKPAVGTDQQTTVTTTTSVGVDDEEKPVSRALFSTPTKPTRLNETKERAAMTFDDCLSVLDQ